MAELKTKKTSASVPRFLKSVENEQQRKDSFELLEIFKQVTKMPPKLWGNSIVGYHGYLRYGEGRQSGSDWGEQSDLSGCRVFVTPNPSPANAAYSLADLTAWYRRLAVFADGCRMR